MKRIAIDRSLLVRPIGISVRRRPCSETNTNSCKIKHHFTTGLFYTHSCKSEFRCGFYPSYPRTFTFIPSAIDYARLLTLIAFYTYISSICLQYIFIFLSALFPPYQILGHAIQLFNTRYFFSKTMHLSNWCKPQTKRTIYRYDVNRKF